MPHSQYKHKKSYCISVLSVCIYVFLITEAPEFDSQIIIYNTIIWIIQNIKIIILGYVTLNLCIGIIDIIYKI